MEKLNVTTDLVSVPWFKQKEVIMKVNEILMNNKFDINSIEELKKILITNYNSNNRFYHNLEHINDCLNELSKLSKLLDSQDLIIIYFAIIFHDIIYDVSAKKWENENNSSIFAELYLNDLWIDQKFVTKVKDMINLTANHLVDENNELWKFMIDIDLSILWRDWSSYYSYAQKIRKEYSKFSDIDYIIWRLNFLEWLLNRQIYQTKYFIDLYEKQAKLNIQKEIQLLKLEIEYLFKIQKLKQLDENSPDLQLLIKEIINDKDWWTPEKWFSSWYISKHEFFWKMTWQLNENWKIDINNCVVMLWNKNWTITSSKENPWTYKYVNLFK